jgi:hypothetical protein
LNKRLFVIALLLAILVLNTTDSSFQTFFVPVTKAVPVEDGVVSEMAPTSTGKFLSYEMEIADNATVYESVLGDVNGDGFNDIIGAVEHVGLSYYT